jgi:uncharacterized Zn finger protein
MSHHPRFDPRFAKPTVNPRRVTGGIKLTPQKPGEASWVTQRWMRLVEGVAPGDQLAEGLEYARLGQTRSLDVGPGTVASRVQGRMPRAYSVAVRLPTYTPEQWAPVIDAMVAQARYAATLLAGELPPNIEDLFIPCGLKLFPTDASDVATSCNCSVFTGIPIPMVVPRPSPPPSAVPGAPAPAPGPAPAPAEVPAAIDADSPAPSGPRAPAVPWCKHVCCAMALVADRLAADPFLIFALRGLSPDDLVERLRQRRAVAGTVRTAGVASPIYTQHLPGIADRTALPLDQCLSSFWAAGPELDDLDLPVEAPEVAHPLLRRMGASPFAGAKFPLVGLLATCYEVVTTSTVSDEAPGEPGDAIEGESEEPADEE